jgi:hypothetical protein
MGAIDQRVTFDVLKKSIVTARRAPRTPGTPKIEKFSRQNPRVK